MVPPEEVREGMTVRSAEGRAVGVVTVLGDVHFELEKGRVSLPRRDYLVDYRDVAAVRGREVILEADAAVTLEEEDDGGALPPRHHGTMDAEPVNAEAPPPGYE
jgi:hypothetical protein